MSISFSKELFFLCYLTYPFRDNVTENAECSYVLCYVWELNLVMIISWLIRIHHCCLPVSKNSSFCSAQHTVVANGYPIVSRWVQRVLFVWSAHWLTADHNPRPQGLSKLYEMITHFRGLWLADGTTHGIRVVPHPLVTPWSQYTNVTYPIGRTPYRLFMQISLSNANISKLERMQKRALLFV